MKKPDLRSLAVPEVVEKEKLGVPLEHGRQQACFTTVVTADALESEVEAVGDARVESSRSVECGSSINAIAR